MKKVLGVIIVLLLLGGLLSMCSEDNGRQAKEANGLTQEATLSSKPETVSTPSSKPTTVPSPTPSLKPTPTSMPIPSSKPTSTPTPIPSTKPEPISTPMPDNENKPDRNGFDELTNVTETVGPLSFSVPDYWKADDTTPESFYATVKEDERTDQGAVLIIFALQFDSPMSFDIVKETAESGKLADIIQGVFPQLFENASTIEYELYESDAVKGFIYDWLFEVSELPAKGYCIVFPEESTNSLYLTFCVELNTYYSYLADCLRLIESCKENDPNLDAIYPDPSFEPAPSSSEVASIEVTVEKTELFVGEVTSAFALVMPEDAENEKVVWTTSKPSVVTIDDRGRITAVGVGTAFVFATAQNGVVGSAKVTVESNRTDYTVSVTFSQGGDYIGNEWRYVYFINDTPFICGDYSLTIGETLTLSARFTEEDTWPDTGEASVTHEVTEEMVKNSFTVSFTVYVTENGGRNKGKSAEFKVTFSFKKKSE